MGKLNIYEVIRIYDDGKDEHKLQFWYLDYADAVDQFKRLVAQAKKLDWIEEGLTEGNSDGYDYEFIEAVDYWGFRREYMFDSMYLEISIEEREVF